SFEKLGVDLNKSFSGIHSIIEIDRAFYSSIVKNNVVGTEASSVNVISGVPLSAPIYDTPPINFIVDHAFVFEIHDREIGVDIHIGLVNKLP
ncbi:hypothetical protein B4U80_14756, partial [Leptotrombidium deliense]